MKFDFLIRGAVLSRIGCGAWIAVCLIIVSGANAQTDESPQAEAPQEKTVDLEDQKLRVKEIYQLTQTARTAKDYSVLLERCDSAIAESLTPKNQAYVVSLKGWALNRRGGERWELAGQLKRVGNAQYRAIMEQALKDFDDAIVADPTRYRSFMSRGIAHMELASSNEVELESKSSDQETPDPASTETDRPDLKRAILDFTTVTELKADHVNGWFNRAEALYHYGAFKKSIEDYSAVLQLRPNDAQALTGRGHAKLGLGQPSQALADYEQVLILQPENATAFINRGDAFAELGKWDRAQADFEKSAAIKESGIACQRLAWLQATCPEIEFRNAEAALKLITRAIELIGDTPSNLETLAAAEAAHGDFDAAQSAQQRAIRLAGAEVDEESSPYQARLALYENEEAFTQEPPKKEEKKEENPERSK